MYNKKVIEQWEKISKKGKTKYILSNALLFFIVIVLSVSLVNYYFQTPIFIEIINAKNWWKIGLMIGVLTISSLAASWLQWWAFKAHYQKLKQ